MALPCGYWKSPLVTGSKKISPAMTTTTGDRPGENNELTGASWSDYHNDILLTLRLIRFVIYKKMNAIST